MLVTVKKYFLIAGGSISVALGVVGIFIPVLPTTPFFLLAVFCYFRSSKRLYKWMIHHKIFGVYIYNYITYKAVLKSTKIGALIFLWTGLSVSILVIDSWYVRAFLILIGVGVSIHLVLLKTVNKSEYISLGYTDEKQEV
ncbi:MAG: YbaN family protein [Clostridia bacterium]|nr:YbaN family protein [Clostridia bacterium]